MFSRHVRCWPSFSAGDGYYYSGPHLCFHSQQVSVRAAADQSSAPWRPGDGGRLNLRLVGKVNVLHWDYFSVSGWSKASGRCERVVKLAWREQWRVFQVRVSRVDVRRALRVFLEGMWDRGESSGWKTDLNQYTCECRPCPYSLPLCSKHVQHVTRVCGFYSRNICTHESHPTAGFSGSFITHKVPDHLTHLWWGSDEGLEAGVLKHSADVQH